MAKLATLSAFFTFISVILATIFAGIEGRPAAYNPDPAYVSPSGTGGGEPIVLAIPAAGTSFVAGLNAFLNISYTFIGQITLPSFIAEMKRPQDFPKALWAVTIAEVIVFSLVGAIVYAYTGNQYMTSPVRYPAAFPGQSTPAQATGDLSVQQGLEMFSAILCAQKPPPTSFIVLL